MLGLGISLAGAALRAQPPFADHLLALDFRNRRYRQAPLSTGELGALTGYSYSRSGAKLELGSGGGLMSFAANVPGIVSEIGYWSRAGLTNLLLQSQSFDSGSWVKAAGMTVTANNVAAPDGTQTAETVNFPTSTIIRQDATITASATYTNSVWARRSASAPAAAIRISSNNTTAWNTGGSSKLVLTDQWQRVPLTGTISGGATIWRTAIGTFDAAGITDPDCVGNVDIWQAQLVPGARAGPVIATTTAAASVGADDLRLSTVLQDEDFAFWAVANFTAAASAGASLASLSGGTSADMISLQRTGAGALAAIVTAGGTAQSVGGGLGVSVPAGRTVVLVRRRAGKFTAACKAPAGTATIGSEGTAAAMPAVNLVHPGSEPGGLQTRDAIEFVGIRKGTFSDAEIAALLQAA